MLVCLYGVLRYGLYDPIAIPQPGTCRRGAREESAHDPSRLRQDLTVEAELIAAKRSRGALEAAAKSIGAG